MLYRLDPSYPPRESGIKKPGNKAVALHFPVVFRISKLCAAQQVLYFTWLFCALPFDDPYNGISRIFETDIQEVHSSGQILKEKRFGCCVH